MEERRRYYRINDDVILRYRQVSEEVMQEGIHRLKSNRLGRSQLRHALLGMEARIQEMIVSIGRARPDFAEVLDLINKKTSLLERMVETLPLETGDDHLTEAPSCSVSLSAGGLSFDSDEVLPIGSFLDIDLVLLPAYQYIKVYGQVTEKETVDEHNAAVDFYSIRSEDREEIVQHVFRKQNEELYRRRIEHEGN